MMQLPLVGCALKLELSFDLLRNLKLEVKAMQL